MISALKPEGFWKYFDQVLNIPRPSKKEDKIIEFLISFARQHRLEYKKDEVGNIVILKPATSGYENAPVVILQSHVDMVCEKNSSVAHDFEKDPIQAYVDNGWIKARGTTLGADNGVGIACQLAILESANLVHGPVECLFTVDEETGLTGAFGLQPGFLKGKILVNLDSEDEGEIFIGCAGGIDTTIYLEYKKEKAPSDHLFVTISVTGLQGGHSGDDIHRGLGNANKILNRILWNAHKKFDTRLVSFNGGNLRNAIAREAFGVIAVPVSVKGSFDTFFSETAEMIKLEYKIIEPNLTISGESSAPVEYVIDPRVSVNLMRSLYACPHGVIAMSHEIPGLVESSTNLAAVKTHDNEIVITTSQRSSTESAKRDVAAMVECTFELVQGKIVQGDGYPGWKPDTSSRILYLCSSSYKQLFKEEPKIKAIHAGLECGVIGDKFPGMDMVSIGPTVKGAHSPDERLHIDSVTKFWDLTIDVLRRIKEY